VISVPMNDGTSPALSIFARDKRRQNLIIS
jgi:hypothetical protein